MRVHTVSVANIYRLGVKELWSLARDPMMLFLIVYTFTLSIYVAATAMPDSLHKAALAIVDEDGSPLSARIVDSFYPPHFLPPQRISLAEMDQGMDNGAYTFVLDIPPNFQRDVLAGRAPAIQLNVDATRMSHLLDAVVDGQIGRLVITHQDRLLRFGAELVFAICAIKNVEVVILNQGEETTLEEDLAQDVLEIITVFSARLYGSRSHQNQKLIDDVKKAVAESARP